jgi:vacuolar-type H+-ATPase subunit E/Vma4
MLSKAAIKARDTLFNLVAENGKKIRDLTGDELDKLESDNVARANLYRELRKQVKGDQIVGEVLDDEHFKRIVDRIGDMKELIELFD